MTTRKIASAIVGSLVVVLLAGCMQSLSEQTKADPNINIKKKTDDIKKFDPKANQKIDPVHAHADDPVLGPVQMLRPTINRIELMNLEHTLDIYNASEGHYPQSYEEFMTKVIKGYGITLTVLSPGWQYAYDVENHKVLIVEAKDAGAKGAAPAANK
jgi:hypothetical protein